MVIRCYRADYVTKAGKVQASYSFQADTNAKALVEARRYKRTLGCESCQECKLKLILTGKVYPEPESKKKRGSLKSGIEWIIK